MDLHANTTQMLCVLSTNKFPCSASPESLSEHGAARVVSCVQPEGGDGGHGGGLPGGLRGRLTGRPAPHRQHGRRQWQHSAALQRVALQLSGGEEAAGRR